MSRGALRITVGGAGDLIVQLTPEQAAGVPPPRPGEYVSSPAASPRDTARGGRRHEVVVDGWRFDVLVEPARHAALRERAIRQAAAHSPTAALTLRAQLPGRVVQLWVSEGEAVDAGQRLLAVEAMKMENEVRAPQAGRVEGLRVNVGGRIELGDELLTIA